MTCGAAVVRRTGEAVRDKVQRMTDQTKTSKPVPVSSSRNSFLNTRTTAVIAVVALFLLVAIFVPW